MGHGNALCYAAHGIGFSIIYMLFLAAGSLRYGAFYDTTDQTAAAINTAYAITL